MASYLAISILKQSIMPEKQLRMFLFYLPQESLKEYLEYAIIYDGKRNKSKYENYLIKINILLR